MIARIPVNEEAKAKETEKRLVLKGQRKMGT